MVVINYAFQDIYVTHKRRAMDVHHVLFRILVASDDEKVTWYPMLPIFVSMRYHWLAMVSLRHAHGACWPCFRLLRSLAFLSSLCKGMLYISFDGVYDDVSGAFIPLINDSHAPQHDSFAYGGHHHQAWELTFS